MQDNGSINIEIKKTINDIELWISQAAKKEGSLTSYSQAGFYLPLFENREVLNKHWPDRSVIIDKNGEICFVGKGLEAFLQTLDVDSEASFSAKLLFFQEAD